MPNTLVGRRPPIAGHRTTIDHGSTVPRGCPVQYLSANAANDIKSNHHALRDFDRLRQSSISTAGPPEVATFPFAPPRTCSSDPRERLPRRRPLARRPPSEPPRAGGPPPFTESSGRSRRVR